MKNIFAEQLTLKQIAESLENVLNEREIKACINKLRATKFHYDFH